MLSCIGSECRRGCRRAMVVTLRVLGFCCAVALLNGAGCGKGPLPPSFPSSLLNEPLPPLGQTVTGAPIDQNQLRGRVVVVKFFARYCEPCERTLPIVQKLHETHPDVAFIGVSLDEHQKDLQATIQRYGLTFPIILDRSNVVSGRFRVRELPITFVVNQQGRVHWVAGPDQEEQDLERILASLQ